MYEDLLAHPNEDPSGAVPAEPNKPGQMDEDIATVRQLEQQLLHDLSKSAPTEDPPLVSKLRKESVLPLPRLDAPFVDEAVELHRRVIQFANKRLDRLDVLHSTSQAPLVPLILFSVKEYQALTRTCVSSFLPPVDN
jgi:hypothetical protein